MAKWSCVKNEKEEDQGQSLEERHIEAEKDCNVRAPSIEYLRERHLANICIERAPSSEYFFEEAPSSEYL